MMQREIDILFNDSIIQRIEVFVKKSKLIHDEVITIIFGCDTQDKIPHRRTSSSMFQSNVDVFQVPLTAVR